MAAVLVGSAGAAGASAQESGTVGHAVMAVDAVDATARVRLDYAVRVPPGVDRIPLTVLSPEPTVVEGVGASVASGALEVVLPPSESAQRVGWIVLPASAGGRTLDVTLDYAVVGASIVSGDRTRTVVPVVAVDWPPAEALPGTFRADVTLPDGAVPFESFPTARAAAGQSGPYALELSVLPAYLTVRSRVGGAPAFTLPRVADAGILALLTLLGLFGYRRMRREM